jgi:hypothetical protein
LRGDFACSIVPFGSVRLSPAICPSFHLLSRSSCGNIYLRWLSECSHSGVPRLRSVCE